MSDRSSYLLWQHRFCNEDCQLKGLEKHKTWCKKWACEKLTTIVEPLGGSRLLRSTDIFAMCQSTRAG